MKNRIMYLLWGGFLFIFIILVSGFVFTIDGFTALKSYLKATYKVYALDLPDTLSFAGKKYP